MAKRPESGDESDVRTRNPAVSVAARENELINLAVDLAERQLREGTASAQVITHYLKASSEREKLERERLRQENDLTQAKIDVMKSQERTEELYAKALDAMRAYSGIQTQVDDDGY